ncbi:MAG: sulfatase [Bacteroides sp.]|nr:sulfatase [Bacteroides sp.]
MYPFSAAMLAATLPAGAQKTQQERPNILWLTFEDTSWYELGCYGNDQVHTPRIDSLAMHGVQFMNAWSVAPQSSAARSSLITGCYATTYGMDIHPVPFDTPPDIFFPQWLREAGYYCTNNGKTHYNSTTDNKSCWDECHNRASYHSVHRKPGQPFFAVFNTVTSHMGRVRTFHTDGRRDYTTEGLYSALLRLPPHVPDLPEVRSDYAGHLEAVQDVDRWVGFFLDDLRQHRWEESTIIFVFSDHGGCQPRGKGYLFETGLRVPLVVYVPPCWQHLLPDWIDAREHSLVSFVDLAPTVLSLAGVEPPEHGHGRALLGERAVREAPDMQFALAANQLHHFMPVRAATDGRYKYMRSYIPYRCFALRNYYQWGMPSNQAWDRWVLSGNQSRPEWEQPFRKHPAEMLFDLEADPFELNDLADDPACASVLLRFRQRMDAHIRQTVDLGFFLPSTRREGILYDRVRSEPYPLETLWAVAGKAGRATSADLPVLLAALTDPHPDIRFWGCVGMAQAALAGIQTEAPADLLALVDDPDPYVAAEAAYAAVCLGETERGLHRLFHPVREEDRKIGYSLVEVLAMDPERKDCLRTYVPQLWEEAGSLPRVHNEDAGLMARGILVDLGEMDIRDMYGPEAYESGLKLNRGRRPMVPLPR